MALLRLLTGAAMSWGVLSTTSVQKHSYCVLPPLDLMDAFL